MPRHAAPIYRRGKYWLDWDRKRDGSLRSPNLTIFWYDTGTGRVRSSSTGTSAEAEAAVILDQRYLNDSGEAAAFCHACGQPLAQASAYLLTDAISDYRLEKGDKRASADTIETRLNHVVDFLDAQDATGGRFGIATSCAIACSSAFVDAFRAWSQAEPTRWRNKAGEVTVQKQRSPASTEAAIAQLIAALNHAANAEPARSDKRPMYKPLPTTQVQRTRRARVSVDQIAEMLRYASQPARRAGSLHRFLVASICTIARPGAVCDISIAPERQQWSPGSPTIDLNPHGRVQNKKRRPVLPVLPVLSAWLQADWTEYHALPEDAREGRGFLVNYHGRGIQDVDRAWSTMLTELKLPLTREWRSYILRHSLATLVRNRGAERWDLEGYMGHRAPSQTETYANGDFPSVVQALSGIIAEIERLAPGSLHRNLTGASRSTQHLKEVTMPG